MDRIKKLTVIIIIFFISQIALCDYGMAGKEVGKMQVLKLEGDYFDIGEQWGKAVKNDMSALVSDELEGLGRFFKRVWYLL